MIILLSIIIILLWILNAEKKNNKKTEKKIYNSLEEIVNLLELKLKIEINAKTITNIPSQELLEIEEKIKKENYNYKEEKIVLKKNIFYLEKNKEKKIGEKARIKLEKLEKLISDNKEKSYLYNKKIKEKIYLLYGKLEKIIKMNKENIDNNLNIKEIIKVKKRLKLLEEFIKEHGNIGIKKEKVYAGEQIVSEIKTRKIKLEIKDGIEESYIKIKEYNIFLQILEIVKTKVELKKEQIEIDKNRILYEFEIENLQTVFRYEFDFFITLLDARWKIEIIKNEFKLEIPIKKIELEENIGMIAISIDSRIEQINIAKEKILEKLRENEFGIDKIRDMNLVLDELLLNAIEYGNKNDRNKKIYIEYKMIDDEKMYISIEDEGEGFDYKNYINLKKISDTGRGIYIVKKMVNSLEYKNNGRKVEIMKNR